MRTNAIAAYAWLILITQVLLPLPRLLAQPEIGLEWRPLPELPSPLGVAGPFVGVHGKALLVAGGANFPKPYWEKEKRWYSDVFALSRVDSEYQWEQVGSLPRSLGYGASVSTKHGIVCVGGNDAERIFSECFMLLWDPKSRELMTEPLPSLPHPLVYAQACAIGDVVYVTGGQTAAGLESAINYCLKLDLSAPSRAWVVCKPWPGPPRAFHMAIAQNNGFRTCLYLMGGRYERDGVPQFLSDCWEYDPARDAWRERSNLPQPVTAGTGIAYGHSHIFVLSGDDGKLFDQTDALREAHPGFPKRTYAYHTITDRWVASGESPSNQVTTQAVLFDGKIVLPTGEVRPRVRTPAVWAIQPKSSEKGLFGWIDYTVLVAYLFSLVAIGAYFLLRTKSTDDYFRAAGSIPWWAAGCSIFATMLSSLTFTGVPSKAFAQDWVYAIGNFMIPLVAFLAVFVAMPFYRRMDATSAYQYLEKRFHISLRLFGSLSFSMFHVFRMAIVMSLTGLALAVATPLTPVQSVLIMGILSILYCAMGGISAVIWTDTLQTVVLLGGALLAIGWMLYGTGNSIAESYQLASASDKLRLANWHWNPADSQIALWVILFGALGQNTSSYTADQAVVQRYLTTPSPNLAARAIWTNGLLTIPATLLFFGLGTCLFLFYQAHPERLDPSIHTDQIFPLFISRELPAGLSGLIVAAVFAAAQSTVSTSMNSVATVIVTDCLRPFATSIREATWLRIAQVLTVLLGVAGTLLAVPFVDGEIKSRFDEFIKVIGLFMGVLGGLFVLGVLFPRVHTAAAWIGVVSGVSTMAYVWASTDINGYLYTFVGIATCVSVGWFASWVWPRGANVEQSGLSLSDRQ